MDKIIVSKDVILRHVRVSDAKSVLECYNDKLTRKNYRTSISNIRDAKKACARWAADFRKKKPENEKWVIQVNSQFAGWVGLIELNRECSEHVAYIGYCIHPDFRRMGLATSATKALSKYAFNKYKLKRISAICRTFNKASARVLEKSGFKFEGIMKNNTFMNGKYLDDMLWARVK